MVQLKANSQTIQTFIGIPMLTFLQKLLGVLLLIISYATELRAQSSPISLNWSDYKGKVDSNSPYNAMTNWDVNYQYTARLKSDTAYLQVKTEYILKNSSWVKQSKKSEELLNHERGHLKFAELVSLEFSYEASKTTFLRSNYQSKVEILFNSILKKYLDLEIRYDNETNHMHNFRLQRQWDEFLENTRKNFVRLLQ